MKNKATSLHQMVRRNDVEGVSEFLLRHRLPGPCRPPQTPEASHSKTRRQENLGQPQHPLQNHSLDRCVSCRGTLLPSTKGNVTSSMEDDVTEVPCNVINRRDSLGRTALHVAACFQRVDIARLLVAGGSDVTAVDSHGGQALQEAVKKACPDLVRLLLQSGHCDVEAATSKGPTPLMIAASYDYADIARLLLKAGASLESRDAEDRRCLHVALEEGSDACAVCLIQAGCDVNAVDGKGRSCLYLATHSPHLFSAEVIRALLTHGYDCLKDRDWLQQERQPSVFYNAQSLYHDVLHLAGITSATPTTCDDLAMTPSLVCS